MLDLTDRHHELTARLGRDLDDVAVVFERQLASELSAVNTLCLHVERYRGKMLRPMLVMLSGMLFRDADAPTSAAHHVVGAVTEMIHMATLVHDDVLDEAEVRRRGATINHLWGNEAAVMLGDYLISNAFHLCSTLGRPEINLTLGAVTNTLCEGELLQLHHRGDYAVDRATYTEIITRKTASLIGACCALGAQLAGATDEQQAMMREIGIVLGLAFQIQDDLLDLLGDESVVGKSLGRDLEKGKLTLPLIVALEASDPASRAALLRLLEARDTAGIRAHLDATGAIDVARTAARDAVDDASARLLTLPDSPARRLFLDLARAIVERRY